MVAGINRPELPRKFFSEKDTSFQNLRVVCETNEDLKNSTQEPTVLLHHSCAKPRTDSILQKGRGNPRPVARVEVIIPDRSANIVKPHAISARRRDTSRTFAGVKQ